jgi:hypothetical protein
MKPPSMAVRLEKVMPCAAKPDVLLEGFGFPGKSVITIGTDNHWYRGA